MRIFRLFYITFIALRFGLDEFIFDNAKYKPLKKLINGLLFYVIKIKRAVLDLD